MFRHLQKDSPGLALMRVWGMTAESRVHLSPWRASGIALDQAVTGVLDLVGQPGPGAGLAARAGSAGSNELIGADAAGKQPAVSCPEGPQNTVEPVV